MAAELDRQIRTGDALYRYGGEEFLVLLPEQSSDAAALAAERLRASIEALALPHPAGGVVTVSAGVAALGDDGCKPDELFELADQALYRAKEGGRNRVELHQGDVAAADTIRLLIADDDPTIRLVMSALVARQDDLELVGEAEDATQAIELTARRRPDVVVLDFDMPGGGGVVAATGDPRGESRRPGSSPSAPTPARARSTTCRAPARSATWSRARRTTRSSA